MPKSKHQIPGRVRSAYEFIKAHRDQYSTTRGSHQEFCLCDWGVVGDERLHGESSRQEPSDPVLKYRVRVSEEAFSTPQDGTPQSHRMRPNTGMACASLGSVPPRADWLRTFVITITQDDHAPTSLRNACHLLMIAIERNDPDLVADSLSELHQIAASENYALPLL
jgi:hypothetical protein